MRHPRPLSTFSLPIWCLDLSFCKNCAGGPPRLLALHWFQPQEGRRIGSGSVSLQSLRSRSGCGLTEDPERRQRCKLASLPAQCSLRGSQARSSAFPGFRPSRLTTSRFHPMTYSSLHLAQTCANGHFIKLFSE